MEYVSALLVVALTVTVWLFLRRLERAERECVETLAAFVKDAEAERRNLLDRIQAPERAADQALIPSGVTGPDHVPFDDDEAFQAAVRERMADG